MTEATTSDDTSALFSNRTLFKITATIGFLALLAAAITVVGKKMGEELVLGGHTDSAQLRHIIVGQDVLTLPDNMIRFAEQRKTRSADIVNIYLSWPAMTGYSRDQAEIFSTPARPDRLIFVDFAQSVMSRDMSGRLEPIYSKLIEGVVKPGPAGLTIYQLGERSGFGQERLLTGKTQTGALYVVRCMLPDDPTMATAADCQRDVHVGKDLTMLYRFSSLLLPKWQEIDSAIMKFAASHVLP